MQLKMILSPTAVADIREEADKWVLSQFFFRLTLLWLTLCQFHNSMEIEVTKDISFLLLSTI